MSVKEAEALTHSKKANQSAKIAQIYYEQYWAVTRYSNNITFPVTSGVTYY